VTTLTPELEILEELFPSHGMQCETIWVEVLDGQFLDGGEPCENPASCRVKISFDCGNVDVRWKCDYCLNTMLTQETWGCIVCARTEPFTLEII
jgi:hypothetical protein